jgi:hypothetical protein
MAEAGHQIDEAAFVGIHSLFIELFNRARDESGGTELRSLDDVLLETVGRKIFIYSVSMMAA